MPAAKKKPRTAEALLQEALAATSLTIVYEERGDPPIITARLKGADGKEVATVAHLYGAPDLFRLRILQQIYISSGLLTNQPFDGVVDLNEIDADSTVATGKL